MNKHLKSLALLVSAASLIACGSNPSPTPSSSSSASESSMPSSTSSSSSESSVTPVSSSQTSEQTSESSSSQQTSQSSSSQQTSESSSSSSSKSQPPQNPGVIKLDDKCNPDYGIQAYTMNYGGFDFEFAGTSEYDEGYITFNRGGYMFNTTAFGDIESFQVEYSKATPAFGQTQADLGFGDLYYVTDTHAIASPRSYARQTVENNTLVTLDGTPNYISFYTFNEIEIKSITINYSVSAVYSETFSNFDMNLFATNDIHGQVNLDDTHAGLSNVSGYIEDQKTQYNLLLDQGDIYQGSLACYLTEGHIMDDFMLMNGYDSTILGNHEWDWMESNILEHRDYSPYVKLLACNVRYKDDTIPSWVRNYYVTSRGGVKIGVIGALGSIEGDISADNIENIKFVTGDPLTAMLKQYANELIAQGCSYVILQIHQGSNLSGFKTDVIEPDYTDIDYSELAGKVDFVLESHSHKSYYHKDQYGISHMQCGGYLSGMGKVTLAVTYEGNVPEVAIKYVSLVNAATIKSKDSTFFSGVNQWYSENVYKEESERKVATVDKDFAKAEIEQMQANAYYGLKDEYSEIAKYDIACGGGHIGCRSPQKIVAGHVTMSDVTNLFPFDNELYVAKIGGKDLKYNFLKESYKLAGPYNKDSKTVFSQYYYIILDSYNYFFLTKQLNTPADVSIEVNLTELHGIHPRDAFAMYLGKQYPVVETYERKVVNTDIDYAKTSDTLNVAEGIDVAMTYSNLADNASYSQFVIKKSGGNIKFVAPASYKIIGAAIKQYQTYKNLTFYGDDACETAIDYTITKVDNNGEFSIANATDRLIVKNDTTYDVKVFHIILTLAKAA